METERSSVAVVVSLTFQEQSYQHIKARIVNRHLLPGEYISDVKVSEELSCSRTPVREAFHRLENEGLLVYEPRQGWRVYSLSLEDIDEIFELKCEVEGMIARKAAACRDQGLRSELSTAMEEMRASAVNDQVDAWLAADERFHALIFEMAGNGRARQLISNLNDQWHRLRIGFIALQGRMTRAVDEHQAVVVSILAGDGDDADRHIQEHLGLVRDELVHLLTTMVLPFARNGV